MRFSQIVLSWFRGAGADVSLDAQGRSQVVYGSNGAGKSSFVDAIEFTIRGKVDHLSHEYSGKRQEHGLLNTHRGAKDVPSIAITLADTTKRQISFKPDGSSSGSGSDSPPIATWDYRRTVLRQDELSRFIIDTKGDKYSALLPLLGLSSLENAAESLRLLARSIDDTAQTKEKAALLSLVRKQRTQHLGTLTDQEVAAEGHALVTRYVGAPEEGESLSQSLERVSSAIAAAVNEASESQQRWIALRDLAAVSLGSRLKELRAAHDAFSAEALPLLDEQLAVLTAAGSLADAITTRTERIRCPACGSECAAADFTQHVAAERTRLERLLQLRNLRDECQFAASDALTELARYVAKQILASWVGADPSRSKAAEDIKAAHARVSRGSLSAEDILALEESGVALVNAAALAAQTAPPEAALLSKDKERSAVVRSILDSEALEQQLTDARLLRLYIEGVEAEVRAELRSRATAVISEISTDVQTLWAALQPGRPISDIHLYMSDGADKAIDVRLTFHGVAQDSPRLTLSEGLRNSLGLCIFLAMARRSPHHDRPLVLDDVIVSLDRQHRGLLADLLLSHFADRQVLIFTHDRDWFAELQHMLPSSHWDFRALLPFDSPKLGIRWAGGISGFDDARAQLALRPDSAANDARKVMDTSLMLVAEKLMLHLPFVRGEKNEMRMAHTLLEYLISASRKCMQTKNGAAYEPFKAATVALEDASKRLEAWANRASHTFDTETSEAESLINSCEAALASFKCASCEKYVWRLVDRTSNLLQCSCGHLRWRYGKDG